ncbi:hypothetical protein ACI48J_12125 [Paenibacillus chitinolyticus]|uniref:hypothetical protein n=1 Tax=Paenibacillus chitinolyticus TaxID=79263 RepID=UPI00386346BB
MKLNHTAFIFIWLVGAGIVFYGIGKLELYLDYERANSVYSNIFLLDSFKILLYMLTGVYSGTLFMTSKLTVHRTLFLAAFILFFILSFYPLLLFAVPLPGMDVIYPNDQKFAFIAGLSLFMSLYKFRGTSIVRPQPAGEPANDRAAGFRG